ncbi:MAG: acyltransferase domain-containing protein [Desulfovibrionaceae bacterium]|nr:acyltransferase domain-containing protein [Desulfovibrionaceae bacterium]
MNELQGLGGEEADRDTIPYDGVAYASFSGPGARLRVGATCASWRSLLPPSENLAEIDREALARSGIYLEEERFAPPLALMCQGMGALWPGAGRELYDEFPAAREAMDRIQAVASWDVLSLLDENDMDRITATRWQIPYLFLLEYAQYAYLASLGLCPALLCGHSLGELIALCFAGIYTPEVAWHILDTRAEHVSVLESKASEDFGMLAVHAGVDVVRDVLDRYPDVRVANYNTPSQFIVGGPKTVLQEIRGSLRKSRIPAVSISVSLLFHHPQMRVLRDHSLLRLNMLSMHPPSIPVISVSKLLLYPNDQESICRFIADLDENPVRFSECLAAMWQYGIRTYIEIGPHDVLAGLISENLPKARVMSAGRKGREARAMRDLAARLYALGYLSRKAIERTRSFFHDGFLRGTPEQKTTVDQGEAEKETGGPAYRLIDLLSRLTGVRGITLNCDLRADLSLRSSSFPLLLHEAERLFEFRPNFEDLLRVVTVGDLLRVFLGQSLEKPRALTRRFCVKKPLLRCVQEGRHFVRASFARGTRVVGSLGIAGFGQDKTGVLRTLVPDLLLGLPGLISSIAFAADGPVTRALSPDTMDIPLSEDFCAADCLLLILLPGEDVGCAARFAKPTVLLRLWDRDPGREALLADGLANRAACLVDLLPMPRERRFHEIGRFLALELSTLDWTKRRHSLWLDGYVYEESRWPTAYREPTSCASLLVPDRLNETSRVQRFSAQVFYAETYDPALSGLTHLPYSRALHVLAYGAWALSPWLRVLGFSDVDFTAMPRLFSTYPRVGRVAVSLRGFVRLYGVLTQQVGATLAIEELLPNGRKAGKSRRIIGGAVIMAPCDLPAESLALGAHVASSSQNSFASGTDLASWYAREGLPKAWRLLDLCAEAADGRLIFSLPWPWEEAGSLASSAENSYSFSAYSPYLLLFECAVQAARYFLARHGEGDRAFSLASAGFVLFSQAGRSAPCRLLLSCTLHDAHRKRFDVRIVNAEGETLLTILQLQFEPAPESLDRLWPEKFPR